MHGLVLGDILIEGIRALNRAVFHTGSAPRTFLLYDVAGLLFQGDGEIAFLPLDALYFGKGKNFDVWMPADLDQFRCENSHRAVVGWKRLVQLGHMPADTRSFLDKVYLEPVGSQIQRGLNSADAATHHQDIAEIFVPLGFRRPKNILDR